jgi:hypothetical protein
MWEEADLMGGRGDTDGMSARERLYAALMRGGSHSPDRSERASQLLDAHAHELAEEIRADLKAGGDWTCCAAARRYAADLIDPEVSDG